MSELVYDIERMQIQFSESDEEWWCLCGGLDWNNDGELESEEVRSLALLGAAVRLAHNGGLGHGILPEAIPEWIRDEIRRLIPARSENGTISNLGL